MWNVFENAPEIGIWLAAIVVEEGFKRGAQGGWVYWLDSQRYAVNYDELLGRSESNGNLLQSIIVVSITNLFYKPTTIKVGIWNYEMVLKYANTVKLKLILDLGRGQRWATDGL